MLKKKVDDARRQEKRIFRVIEDNTETSLTKVKKWITQTEAEEIMERTYNSPRPTTRAILHNMEEKGMIQTTTYSGRRFYAPTTLSMSVLLAAIPPVLSVIIMLVMIDIYPLITGHTRNLGAYVVSSSPVMLAVVWLLLNRKINSGSDTGICLKCGRVIDAGEKYCSECKKSKKKATVKKKPEERVWYLFNERRIKPEEIADKNGLSLEEVNSIIGREKVRRHNRKCGDMDCWDGNGEWGVCLETGKQRHRYQYICEKKIEETS